MMEWNTNERREITAEVITCVYCGHEYPRGTPAHGADVLTEHIKICEKHPMRDLEQQLAAANAELAAERDKVKILTEQINRSITQCACGEYGKGNPCEKCSDKRMKQLYDEVTFWKNKAEQATENERQHARNFDWKETRR